MNKWIGAIIFIVLLSGFSTLYLLNTHHNEAGSRMDSLASGQAAYGQQVAVVVVNLRPDGALDTNAALLHGDFYLLMGVLESNNQARVFFNTLEDLQAVDDTRQGIVSEGNPAYDRMEVGQFSRLGKEFHEETLKGAGVRAVEIYDAPKQKDKYGQVLGEVVMSNGNRYPIQIIQTESKYLGL